MTALQSKYTGWLIHLTIWAVIFGMPLFVTNPHRPLMSGPEYGRFLVVPLSFMVVFYTNYLLLIDRYLTSRRIGRFLGWNLLLIGTVMVGVHLLFRYVLPPDAMRPPMVRPWQETLRFFTGNALLYMLVVGVGVAIRMTGGWYHAETARRELERSRTEAELQNLKSQLNPHFLFNTLNNIYSLIQLDADRAQSVVHDLSRLLRYVLYDSSRPTVPLRAEVDFLRDYISLMRIRQPRHVRIYVSLPEEPSQAPVAPLLFMLPRAGHRLPAQTDQLRRFSGGDAEGARMVRDQAPRRSCRTGRQAGRHTGRRARHRTQAFRAAEHLRQDRIPPAADSAGRDSLHRGAEGLREDSSRG